MPQSVFWIYLIVVTLSLPFHCSNLTELPDDREGHQKKQFVIAKLPLTAAEECYKLWGHNTCNTYIAHHQVAKVLSGRVYITLLMSFGI